MADNPHYYGFRWQGSLGGAMTQAPQPYKVENNQDWQDGSAVSVGLSIGDPVKLLTNGKVTLAAAGEGVFGIVVGFYPYFDGRVLKPTDYIPNQTDDGGVDERETRALVVPCFGQVWAIDHSGGSLSDKAGYEALIGLNANHILTALTTGTGRVAADPRINLGSNTTASGGQWRYLGVNQQVNTDYTGANVSMLVTYNSDQTGEGALPVYQQTGI